MARKKKDDKEVEEAMDHDIARMEGEGGPGELSVSIVEGKPKVGYFDENGDEVPVFVLRADKPGHLQVLAAVHGLPHEEQAEARRILRQFDLYEEAHR